MRVAWLGCKEDALARPGLGAPARHDSEWHFADLHQQLGFGAHRLDHHDFRGYSRSRGLEVLGPDAVLDLLPLGAATRLGSSGWPAGAERLDAAVAHHAVEH